MSLSFSHAHNQGSGTTEVVAVLIAITDKKARVLTVDGGKLLPNGPLTPLHRSLQAGVRQWVEAQTGQPLGYIEQLYTFVDTNRRNKEGHALVYVSYMGLVQEADIKNLSHNPKLQPLNNTNEKSQLQKHGKSPSASAITMASDRKIAATTPTGSKQTAQAQWRDWYDYFPWENHLNLSHTKTLKDKSGSSAIKSNDIMMAMQSIVAQLIKWANQAENNDEIMRRLQRICLCWGCRWHRDLQKNSPNSNTDSHAENRLQNQQDCVALPSVDKALVEHFAESLQERFNDWVAEHALLRYEMLYEAGLLPESPDYQPTQLPHNWQDIIGEPMYYDHRRVIATAISRLRAKIEYRPLIFGLMPPEFTLLQLQQSVEALSGVRLHKQNFRRLLESQDLLEPTGNSSQTGRGRPAKLYRFRFDVELQSLLMDTKLPKRQ